MDLIAPLDAAEAVRRLRHVLGLPFTAVTALGLLAALALWATGATRRTDGPAAPVVVAASFALLCLLVPPELLAIAVAWLLAFHAAVERLPRAASRPVVLVLLAVLVVAPVLGAGVMARRGGYASEVAAFATNMMLLRCWGFAADRWTGRQRTSSLGTFLAAQLFFPTVTNGPIEVPRAMASGWGPVDAAAARAGLARVAGGVAKLLVVGIALRPGWTAALGAMGDAPARRLWLASALLWVWFFLSFSAWSDVAIGLGRLWGHTVPENFDAPWLAADPRDFWRRWHVSFGHWLRDYVYVPLGGNRRHQAANVLAVFAVSALWHVWGALKLLGLGYYPPRAWTGFLVWGALNAGGVLVARATLDRVARRGGRGLGAARAATFAFEAACWLPFFVPASVPPAVLARMLARLIWPW